MTINLNKGKMYLEVKNYMNLGIYFLDNYVMIFELMGLLIMLGISAHISARIKRMTLIVVILLFVESILFYVELWTQTFAKMSLLRPFFTSCKYTIYPLILIFVMQIITKSRLSRRNLILLLLPEIISVPFYFTSQYTHLVCWFTEDNSFMGGPLRYLPYAVFIFYSLAFLINNIFYFKKYSRTYNFIIMFITLGPFVGVFYYMYSRKDNDYSALFTSALLLYFICIYIHMAKIDTLTELLNRQSFYQDIRSNARLITAVVSVDMNNLKLINDGQGHKAGDTALRTVSDIMRTNCGENGTAYRIGGDEFIILYTNTSEGEVQKYIEAIRSKMSKTPYSCAFGYVMKDPDDDFKDVVNKADRKMYENKAEYKKAKNS